jgi:hypothetical protein
LVEQSQTLDIDGEDFSDDAEEAMENTVTVTEVEEIKVVTN